LPLRPLLRIYLVVALAGTAAGIVLLLTPNPLMRESRAVPAASSETLPAADAQPADSAPSTDAPSAATIGIGRLIIPEIALDAPVIVRGIDANGRMEVPDGPEDVAWYDFTARPGQGGNIVLSGHLDRRNYGPAVFARLRELTIGDLVELRLEDGTTYQYFVTQSVAYEAEGAPLQEIVGPTSRETLTLITCDGTFNGASMTYSHRLVVKAERL
jgi:LPXTG-site transpeptidase (sortase) family protein